MIAQRERSYKILLFVADILSIAAAFYIAVFIRFNLAKSLFERQGTLSGHLTLIPYAIVIWLIAYRFSGLYNPVLKGSEEFLALIKGSIVGILLAMGVLFFYREVTYSRALLMLFALFAVAGGLVFRILFRWLRHLVLKGSQSLSRLLIVGRNDLGITLADELDKRPIGYEVTGFLDDTNALDHPLPLVGRLDELEKVIREKSINEVWIALKDAPRDKIKQLVEICLKAKISWRIVPDLYEVMLDWMRIDNLAGIPLIGIKRSNIIGLNIWIKRSVDIICSALLIVLAAVPMGIIALLIKILSPGPILFLQKRVGQNGKRFTFLKFRTMQEGASRLGHKDFTEKWIKGAVEGENDKKDEPVVYKIKDDPRIIPYIGKFLRRFSLDELPQFFNVFKGDMSIVGPRPALPYEVENYKEWHRRRLEAKPGITGLWQVNGRNLLSFEEMVKLDIYYIENWSIWTDFNILLKTFWAVVGYKAY
ncbi:MAG: sugar transferase [Planctomycetota bacterium]